MEENKVIFSMDHVGKIYPVNKQVLRDISLGYFYGAKIGVLGLNGSGKSTLLRIMAGVEKDFIGRIAMSKGYTIGYLEQEPELDLEKTVKDIVEEGASEIVNLLKRYDEINNKFAEEMTDDEMNKLLEEQGNLQDKLDACNAWDIESRLEMAMNALRCPPSDMPIKLISGGEKRRVALCRLLLQEPDILLLDEPTNHLDAETVLWLEKHLQDYKGTVIAVTHDRYFLDHVAGWILELDRGYGIPWKGNYTSWLEQKSKRLALEEKKEVKRQQQLARELEWIRATPKARHEKNQMRIKNYESLLAQTIEKRDETNELHIPVGPKLGNTVIKAKNLSKGYDDKLLFENLEFQLPAGGIVGIIGANGAGKTTLFRLITGEETPDNGQIEIGETVKISYVDQNRFTPSPSVGNAFIRSASGTDTPTVGNGFTAEASGNDTESQTILEIIGKDREILEINGRQIPVRQYISWFNFASADHNKKISELSGGERNRCFLALTLQEGGNVLLLDEPTNDLDINTIRALEEALIDFPGCAVVISHDRYFLDRICTHILAFEGDSATKWFDGNFSEYEEDKLKRLGEKALIPKRITYRKLTR